MSVTAAALILASASPRRRELLARLYPQVAVEPSPLDEPERRPAGVGARSWAAALAYYKARAVAERHPATWVLAADTVVECAGALLGKPRDRADAQRMLEMQARCAGDVITAVCLLRLEPAARLECIDVTRVWMRDDAAVRAAYLDSGDWRGKAGAYGIQDVGDRLVSRIEGSFSNVVGLPLERVGELLRTAGLVAGGE